MTRTALLLCLMAGCATERAYKYSGGPAGAPAFSPSLDAPHTTGQPGYLQTPEQMERNRRVLPETEKQVREPGIWQTDDEGQNVKAVRAMVEQREKQLLAPVPSGKDAPPGISAALIEKCWSDAADLMRMDREVFNMSRAEFECLRIYLTGYCTGWHFGRAKAYLRKNTPGKEDWLKRYFSGKWSEEDFDDYWLGKLAVKECDRYGGGTRRMWLILNRLHTHGAEPSGKDWRADLLQVEPNGPPPLPR